MDAPSRWCFPIHDPVLVEGVLRIVAGRAGLVLTAAPPDTCEPSLEGDVAVVRTRRRFRLEGPDHAVANARIADRVLVDGERRERGRTQTLEIEAEPEAVEAVLRLLSELARAHLIERGGERTREPRTDEVDRLAVEDVRAFVLRSVRERVGAFLEDGPSLADSEDTRSLLRLRGIVRRLRASLALFVEYLPPRLTDVAPALDPILTSLDAVRTLRHQRDRWRQWAEDGGFEGDAADELLEFLVGQHDRATEHLRRAFASEAFLRVRDLLRLALEDSESASAGGESPVAPFAARALEERFVPFREEGIRLAPDSPPQAFHRLLGRCESLRYALERFAPVLRDVAASAARPLAALHERLLRHQDADLAARHLRVVALRTDLPSGREAVFALGALSERHREEARAALALFPDAFLRAVGKRWERVRGRLARLEAAAGGPAAVTGCRS